MQNYRLPPFWRNNPELWFLQVEAAFQALQVRSDETKYSLVVSLLDPDSLQELSDVVRSLPPDRKYDHLKAMILKRLSDSADRQLLHLLTQLELGDRKPSQLLRQMRTLAGSRVSEDVLRLRWLDLLPVGVQRILKVLKSHGLEGLAAAADELLGGGFGVMSAASQPPHSSSTTCATTCAAAPSLQPDVATELAALRIMMRQLMSMQREILDLQRASVNNQPRRTPSGGRSRPRARTPAAGGSVGVCHYHRRWGADAQRCTTPCAFRGASSVSSAAPGN